MSGKTILFSALIVFAIIGLFKVFRPDTTDPNAVIKRYLSHWESNNTTGMYPLISQRAKEQLVRQKVNNVSDYYSYFVEHRSDLTGFEITSQKIASDNGRFWVNLKLLDFAGREYQQAATFMLVKQLDGWRVDGWQAGAEYALP
jgi:hypothetical protein